MDVFEPTGSSSRRGKKRKSTSQTEVESKKIAKLNTCEYVYEKLFVQGEDSDITVAACGREWKVHKLYLKQARFFEVLKFLYCGKTVITVLCTV
uniref:BTB domain-containing protein n=2 Tax=Caenorhabditis japonica TaxID=281687 RepID=A0A8R1HYS7_CAEJA